MDSGSPQKSVLSSPIRIRKFTFPDKNGGSGTGSLAGGGKRGGTGGSIGLAGESGQQKKRGK